jgi:hypothetical protein
MKKLVAVLMCVLLSSSGHASKKSFNKTFLDINNGFNKAMDGFNDNIKKFHKGAGTAIKKGYLTVDKGIDDAVDYTFKGFTKELKRSRLDGEIRQNKAKFRASRGRRKEVPTLVLTAKKLFVKIKAFLKIRE